MENVYLEDWIGEDVAVQFMMRDQDDEPQQAGCTMQSADESGVMLSYQDASDPSQRLYFFPWHRIDWIHRLPK